MMKKAVIALTTLVMIVSIQSLHSQDLNEIMSQITNPAAKATFDANYNFDAFLKGEWSDGSNKMVYESYVTKGGGNIAMKITAEGVPTTIIIDTKNNSMVVLMENGGQKTGMAMAINADAIKDLATDQDNQKIPEDIGQLKTGKTKTILGYSCDEYLITDGSTETHIWISEKLGNEIGRDALANQKVFGGAFAHSVFENGMVLEYTVKHGGSTSTLKVTDINLNKAYTVSTSGYQVMSLGSGM